MEDIDLSSIMVQPEMPEPILPDLPEPPKKPTPRKGKVADSPPEETDERITKITRMTLYFGIFPAKLKAIKPKKPLESLSDEELERVEKEMDFIMGAKSDVELAAKSAPGIIKAIEEFAAALTPLRIQGTHCALMTEEGQDLVKCVLIDSGMGGASASSYQRLALLLLTTAAQRHTINTGTTLTDTQKQAAANALAGPGPVDEKYADL